MPIAEGDLLALRTHQTWPGDEHYVTMDFYRFDEEGKIVRWSPNSQTCVMYVSGESRTSSSS